MALVHSYTINCSYNPLPNRCNEHITVTLEEDREVPKIEFYKIAVAQSWGVIPIKGDLVAYCPKHRPTHQPPLTAAND